MSLYKRRHSSMRVEFVTSSGAQSNLHAALEKVERAIADDNQVQALGLLSGVQQVIESRAVEAEMVVIRVGELELQVSLRKDGMLEAKATMRRKGKISAYAAEANDDHVILRVMP